LRSPIIKPTSSMDTGRINRTWTRSQIGSIGSKTPEAEKFGNHCVDDLKEQISISQTGEDVCEPSSLKGYTLSENRLEYAVAKFDDALRGYAHAVLQRDNYICRYCGLDGKIWPNWLYFSWDHLLPPGHTQRDEPEFIVAACRFCNECCNRKVWDTEGKTPEQLIQQKLPFVTARREEYQRFWEQEVQAR
jgi:hypothetical protein